MSQALDHDHASAQLRAAGLRVTGPRLGVLAALDAQPHASVEAIATRVRRTVGTVSTQAVYDVLSALTTAGLARRIEPAGSPAIYETRVGDNHHHLVCRSCGSVADVDCVVGAAPCLTPADLIPADLIPADTARAGDAAIGSAQLRDFVVDEAEVVFWGLCSACSDRHHTTANPTVRKARL